MEKYILPCPVDYIFTQFQATYTQYYIVVFFTVLHLLNMYSHLLIKICKRIKSFYKTWCIVME